MDMRSQASVDVERRQEAERIYCLFQNAYRTGDSTELKGIDDPLAVCFVCLLETEPYALRSSSKSISHDSWWPSVRDYLCSAEDDVVAKEFKLYLLGAFHAAGNFSDFNKVSDALAFFDQSAALGCHEAINEIAYFCQEKDPLRAVALFRHAAEDGDCPAAWVNLARCFQEGIGGVEIDEKLSLLYLSRSGAIGLHSLALCFEAGLGTETDWVQAAVLYRQAIDKLNCSESMFRLHIMCERGGHGLQRDLEQATQWLDAAASRGHLDAKKKRDSLIDDMFGCLHLNCSCKALL